jgi:hypothetical protein
MENNSRRYRPHGNLETNTEEDKQMTDQLKPANQDPDFGKHCQHGSLKRQCYTCELEEEIAELKLLLLYGLRQMQKINGTPDKCINFSVYCPNHSWILKVEKFLEAKP